MRGQAGAPKIFRKKKVMGNSLAERALLPERACPEAPIQSKALA